MIINRTTESSFFLLLTVIVVFVPPKAKICTPFRSPVSKHVIDARFDAGFDMWTLLAEWLKLMCFNFPFAFFTQLFIIQPTVRTIFKVLFAKDIKARKAE